MTETEHTMKHEDIEARHEKEAAEAFDRIRKQHTHWRDWRFIAVGLETGRRKAMREAHTNEPRGRPYYSAMKRWMDGQEWPRQIDKATTSHCFWLVENLAAVEAWRETLAGNQRDKLNHPTSVKKAYENAHRVAEAKAAGETVKSSMAQLKEALIESETERDNWKRRAEEGGSMFDLRRDTPESIARIMVEQCAGSRIERIMKALRIELKRQKEAHAA